MDNYTVFPNLPMLETGVISKEFLNRGITHFIDACRYVSDMTYGYNSDRDDSMSLFKERKGTCTTKHAVIATLAIELDLPITKTIGIYAMTEDIVTGTNQILDQYHLPYVPMLHCFLAYENYRVDLTEGNHNGKNRSIEAFLFTKKVSPNISAKDEYLLYRQAIQELLLSRDELQGVLLKTVLHAREAGLNVLKSNVE